MNTEARRGTPTANRPSFEDRKPTLRDVVELMTSEFFPDMTGAERGRHIRSNLDFAEARTTRLRRDRLTKTARADVKGRRPTAPTRTTHRATPRTTTIELVPAVSKQAGAYFVFSHDASGAHATVKRSYHPDPVNQFNVVKMDADRNVVIATVTDKSGPHVAPRKASEMIPKTAAGRTTAAGKATPKGLAGRIVAAAKATPKESLGRTTAVGKATPRAAAKVAGKSGRVGAAKPRASM